MKTADATTSRSSAARSLWPFMRRSKSARIATSSLVPPGARFSRRISSCRRGSEAKCRSLASASLGCARQLSIASRKLFAVRTEVAGQGFEEGQPLGLVEMVIAVENLARHRGAGGFAPARQQRLAQGDQLGAIRFRLRTSPTRRSSVRPRSEIEARRSEKKALLLMSGGSNPDLAESYMDLGQSRSQSSGRKAQKSRQDSMGSPSRPDPPHFIPENSVGVLPVTCRKACENAGTLA